MQKVIIGILTNKYHFCDFNYKKETWYLMVLAVHNC